MSRNEIPEVKSLRWLANMFPYVDHPQDETDKISNAIHLYCTAGADKIEQLQMIPKYCEPKYLGENTAIGCRSGECKCGNIVRSYQDYCDACGVRLCWDNVHS